MMDLPSKTKKMKVHDGPAFENMKQGIQDELEKIASSFLFHLLFANFALFAVYAFLEHSSLWFILG